MTASDCQLLLVSYLCQLTRFRSAKNDSICSTAYEDGGPVYMVRGLVEIAVGIDERNSGPVLMVYELFFEKLALRNYG